jgi:hypothetical protein
VDRFEVFCDHLAGFLVLLLDDNKGLNGFFALPDDAYNGLGNLDRYNGLTTPTLSYEKTIYT